MQNKENDLLSSGEKNGEKNEYTEKNSDDITQYFETDYMHNAVFNMTGEYFLLSYNGCDQKDKKEGTFLFEIDDFKGKILKKTCLMKYKNNNSKIVCLCRSNFLYNKIYPSDIKSQKKTYVYNYYSVVAAIKENSLFLWKLAEFPKKNGNRIVKKILEITDFKYFLNFCLWIDAFTIILIDENGKMWFVKFNCLEIGLPLKLNS